VKMYSRILFITILFLVDAICGRAIRGSRSLKPSAKTKRYFLHPEHPSHQHSHAKSFLHEVLDEVSGYHHQPQQSMDFFDNGASWDHFRTPIQHHGNTFHHEEHGFKINVGFRDPEMDTDGQAHAINSMVEAYPGEIVSGENSLSKFIAPPMFDDGRSFGRHKIHKAKKYPLRAPDGDSTEKANTKKLVNTLNSFMTPIKSQSTTFERKMERAMWGGPDEASNSQSVITQAVEEAKHNALDTDEFGEIKQQQSANSRENLERLATNEIKEDHPDYEKESYSHHENSDYSERRPAEGESSEREHSNNEENRDSDEPDFVNEKGEKISSETARLYESLSQDDDNRLPQHEGASQHEEYGREPTNGQGESRDITHQHEEEPAYDHEEVAEHTGSEASAEDGNNKGTPKPIEVMQDESGKLVPLKEGGEKREEEVDSKTGSKRFTESGLRDIMDKVQEDQGKFVNHSIDDDDSQNISDDSQYRGNNREAEEHREERGDDRSRMPMKRNQLEKSS